MILFHIFLGVYAFENPDEQAYYLAGTDTTEPALVREFSAAVADRVTDIHDGFVLWFTWMFFNIVLFWALILMHPALALFSEGVLRMCRIVLGLLFSLSMLAAWTMGVVIRYGEAGSFASNLENAADGDV